MSGAVPGSAHADATQRVRLLLDATIVTVGGRDWTGRDLVTAGALSGRWCTLEANLVRGLACLEDRTPPREPVQVALRDFRYARRLLSADEFTAWLLQRELTLKELTGAIERKLARKHGGGTRVADRHSALAALPAEAVYTGALLDCAEWLADRIVCLEDLPPREVKPAALEQLLDRERKLIVFDATADTDRDRRARAELVLAASAAYDARIADVCSARAIAKVLQRHALDWLRFELTGFTCTTAGAAAEIAALLREGTSPGLITEVSGVPAEQLRIYLQDAPAAIQGWLGGAVAGAVIGPAVEQDAHQVWLVRSRQPPDAGDPSIAAKARAQLAEEYLRKRRAGKVKWHDRH
ncbi:MAG: hypothetical protein JO132_13330 [Streptosporangiaceae bacterium]|nr:hypothetical protein [Streptosporangiaceae bacterium]